MVLDSSALITLAGAEALGLHQYRKGKITLRQGAELLGISYLEMNELLRENHIPLVRDPGAAVRRKPKKARRFSRSSRSA